MRCVLMALEGRMITFQSVRILSDMSSGGMPKHFGRIWHFSKENVPVFKLKKYD